MRNRQALRHLGAAVLGSVVISNDLDAPASVEAFAAQACAVGASGSAGPS